MAPPRHLRWPIALSVLAAVVTIGMKGTAYALTGSVGLLSDALEGLVNLVAAVTAYAILWYASRPADPSHPFGHEKIEYFSSGLEGVLIIVAGLGTAGYAVRRLLAPEPLRDLELGTLIGLAAAGVNLVVARVLLHHGRRHNSIVLEADGQHLMTDVWTSVAVLGGLALVFFTGVEWFDPVLAILVGLNIVHTGGEFVVKSFNMLRTRRAGRRRFAEFHLLVDGDLTVRAAHHIAHVVEAALLAALPGLEVMIHVEPVDEDESWEGEALERLGETKEPLREQP
jgi:divalent metal cation (Fe/Co/Zn/Cd) transporter